MKEKYLLNVLFALGFLIIAFYYKYAYLKISILDSIFFPNLDNEKLFKEADNYAFRLCIFFSVIELTSVLLLFVGNELPSRFAQFAFFSGVISIVILRMIYIVRRTKKHACDL